MKIYDLKTQPIKRIQGASSEEVAQLMASTREPLIFTDLQDDLAFLKSWDLDFFANMNTEVPVQEPESDGVNYFFNYFSMKMSDFIQAIKSGRKLYIGAREITTEKGEYSNEHGLGELKQHLKIPDWIDKQRIWSSNLWIGAGNNKTLIHYDPWDSVLLLGQGEKTFYVFPETETPRMHPFSIFNYKALLRGSVLASRIRPMEVQKNYADEFAKAEGFKGKIEAGEVIFIPAGCWHYVESFGTNIGINFFVHFKDRSLQWIEPLRTYWIKDNIMLWPVRFYIKGKYHFFKTLRMFIPKKTT